MLYTCNRPRHVSCPQERRPIQKVFKQCSPHSWWAKSQVPHCEEVLFLFHSEEEKKKHYEKTWAWLPKENSNIMKCNRNINFFWNHFRNQFRFMQEDSWKLYFLHLCSHRYRISSNGTITKLYVFTRIHRTGIENWRLSERLQTLIQPFYTSLCFLFPTPQYRLNNAPVDWIRKL